MYQYTEFDKPIHPPARRTVPRPAGALAWPAQLSDDEFRPLRLQNGWYMQRYAPMLRVAVPYGELNSAQLRVLAKIARDYDRPTPELLAEAQATQDAWQPLPGPRLTSGYGHFTTRQNVQFNWIPLDQSADVMDLLASVNMHGIQTSGNCIRNITSDERAGIAVDEIADPRPFAEILRQWSTLHPEFAFLPRKFKIAITAPRRPRRHRLARRGPAPDPQRATRRGRAGLQGAGGRRHGPHARHCHHDPRVPALEPDHELPGSRGARLQPLGPARQHVQGAHQDPGQGRGPALHRRGGGRVPQIILEKDGAPHTITQAELDRVRASFVPPGADCDRKTPTPRSPTSCAPPPKTTWSLAAGCSRTWHRTRTPTCAPSRCRSSAWARPRATPPPTSWTLPPTWPRVQRRRAARDPRPEPGAALGALRPVARTVARRPQAGPGPPNIRLLTDMIACPGGDFCALANARSLPMAAAITERYQDLDELHDLGEIDLHISGCINSCGHHHSGHIGILGVDKDGKEWYQVTLGGSDGSALRARRCPARWSAPRSRGRSART
jgi:sulfite reductase (NADPH) hemoprotein beta-component